MIGALPLPTEAAIVDVGGGTSRLAGELLRRGHREITVVDVSANAMAIAREAIPDDADRVAWEVADARRLDLGRAFDLWHDRALLHFMVEPADRAGYVSSLRSHLRPGGHAVIATFGPEGPTRCSGLPVRRYGADELAGELGPGFRLIASELVEHRTPAGNTQQFLYATLRRQADQPHETVDGLLTEARSGLERLTPIQAREAQGRGAVLVDIRSGVAGYLMLS